MIWLGWGGQTAEKLIVKSWDGNFWLCFANLSQISSDCCMGHPNFDPGTHVFVWMKSLWLPSVLCFVMTCRHNQVHPENLDYQQEIFRTNSTQFILKLTPVPKDFWYCWQFWHYSNQVWIREHNGTKITFIHLCFDTLQRNEFDTKL